ncbi:MAG: PAAR-like protein, partial [Planctomycetota bacterium]
MAKQVVMGAMMQCSFGVAPSSLIVLPVNRVMVENKP